MPGTSPRKIHLIVPCTARKRSVFGQTVELSDIEGRNYIDLAKKWFDALEQSDALSVSAKDLYAGEAWSLALELSNEFDFQWVVSAGYGFICADHHIKPYDATFSSGNKNSIPIFNKNTVRGRNKAWWDALHHVRKEVSGQINNIEELFLKYPRDQFLILGSKTYFELIKDDIERCLKEGVIASEQVVIIASSQVGSCIDFQTVLFSGHLRKFFGGTMAALNYRVVKWLISKDLNFCVKDYREMISSIRILEDEEKKIKKPKMDGKEIEKEIEKILAIHGSEASSYTKALSLFRKKYGLSCEQKKFSELYKKIRSRQDNRM